MKNADLPAMPIPNGADGRPWKTSDLGNPSHVVGLTKREYFAGLAMQGLLSSNNDCSLTPEICAQDALLFADELLAELERTK